MTGTQALTMREIYLGLDDKAKGLHWSRDACWCEARHKGGEAGLAMTAPPWDKSRDGERAR